MTTRYVRVRTHKRSVGKACILAGCHRSATVTAVKVRGSFRMDVALCAVHADEGGVT